MIMKTISSCIICIVCISTIVMGQVKDDFSDGNFTDNPEWVGDTGQFDVNSTGQLHLNSTGSDTSVLFTRHSSIKNTEWSFWVKLSFNTSSNNHARIYLAADTSELRLIENSYYLQAGGGDDSVFILKQTGGVVKTIFRFTSCKTVHSTNTLRFKITSDDSGHWEALIDTTGGFNYFSDGKFFDDSFTATRWFGVLCRYTSSNAAKFYFDNFYAGPVITDTEPPYITGVETVTPACLQITFSEPVQKTDAENPGNYLLQGQGKPPDSVLQDHQNPAIVSVFLQDSIAQGGWDSLHISNIRDLTGNSLPDTIVRVCYYRPEHYDILIHEIMADPDPPVELPDGEFVELYNRTACPINLRDWRFKYGSYTKIFPSLIIPPKGYLIIVKDSAFQNFGKCAVLFTSSSSLSNEGTTLVLEDSRRHVIHSVSYSPDWYRGSFKEEGGWSLEMTDSSNPCGCAENWGASKDASGGTPGRPNSISRANPDEVSPAAIRAFISDSAVLEVTFSEQMDSISLLSPAGWGVNDPDGVLHPVRVVPEPPGFNLVKLVFDQTFKAGTHYTLRIAGDMKDCAGNRCDSMPLLRFAVPEDVTGRDVVINEILSNPATGGSRFVELYNRSEKVIDLKTMVMAKQDTVAGFQENAVPLTERGYLFFPGDYIALTSSPDDICDRYRPLFPQSVESMNGFPVFSDDSGAVIIARKDNLEIIDEVRYNPGMHYPLLATAEGVSLERTSPDLPSEYQNNWHSAAETVGFATPGYQNSHWSPAGVSDMEIRILPAVFSPDNDGRDDLLVITIQENEPDYAVSIFVYDKKGRQVAQPANNVLMGNESIFVWDGMTATRTKAPIGFYILLVELTRPDGTVKKNKRTVVLGGKL